MRLNEVRAAYETLESEPSAGVQRKLLTVDSPDLERIRRAGQTFVAVRSTLVVPTDAEVARFARTMSNARVTRSLFVGRS